MHVHTSVRNDDHGQGLAMIPIAKIFVKFLLQRLKEQVLHASFDNSIPKVIFNCTIKFWISQNHMLLRVIPDDLLSGTYFNQQCNDMMKIFIN